VHAAHRVRLDRERQVLVDADLPPPDPPGVRVVARERAGALDLPEDFDGPDAARVEKAGRDLATSKGAEALVYLATLMVADAEFWTGLEPVLKEYASDGSKA